jgi:hypothetical protein
VQKLTGACYKLGESNVIYGMGLQRGIYRGGLIENRRMEMSAVRAYFVLSFGSIHTTELN